MIAWACSVAPSPAARQAPDPRRYQLDGIPCRITEVHGLASRGPVDFFFDDHAVFAQFLAPGIQRYGFNAQSKVPRSPGAMSRQWIAFQRGIGKEGKQDIPAAYLEENVTATFPGKNRQAENCLIKCFSFIKVVDVDGRLDDGLDSQGCFLL